MSDDDFELPPHRSLRTATAAPRRGLDNDIFSPPIKPTSTRPGARYAPLAPARDIDEDDEEDDDEEGAGGLRLRTEEPIRLSKEADDGAADDEQAETPEKSAWDPVPLFEPSGASGGSSPAARLSDEIAKLKQRFDEQPPQMQRWPCANCPTSWSWDLSASLIFREQTLDASGEPSTRVGHNQPRDWLFGGGCVAGGLIFRPGPPTRIVCGNGGDCGGYCHEWCAPTDASTPVLGPSCKQPSSWRPEDVHIYLQRETAERRRGDYRNNVYNEFLVDGRWWTKHLPATVDAIVTGCDRRPDGSCDGHSSVGKAGASGLDAEQVHKKFLRKYGLSAADVPLLEWTGQVDRPFRIAGTQYGDEGY